jgi:hypothetical protein
MPPTDNDPKDPTNEEIVHYLQRGLVMRMRECPILKRKIGKQYTNFKLRTKFQGAEYIFEGMWLDGTANKVLAVARKRAYPRAKAIASLIDDKCFPSVEAWAVACRNALGDNIDTFPLAGSIFVDGQCVDELLNAEKDERFAGVLVVASPADDKTDDKQPASPVDQTDAPVDDLAAQVKTLHYKTDILVQIVQELVHRISYDQFMMTNASPPAASCED